MFWKNLSGEDPVCLRQSMLQVKEFKRPKTRVAQQGGRNGMCIEFKWLCLVSMRLSQKWDLNPSEIRQTSPRKPSLRPSHVSWGCPTTSARSRRAIALGFLKHMALETLCCSEVPHTHLVLESALACFAAFDPGQGVHIERYQFGRPIQRSRVAAAVEPVKTFILRLLIECANGRHKRLPRLQHAKHEARQAQAAIKPNNCTNPGVEVRRWDHAVEHEFSFGVE
jgi:hypothetical protein